MTTEITNQVLEREIKGAKVALDDSDMLIARHEQKLTYERVNRQTIVDRIAALIGDFPALKKVVDEYDAGKVTPTVRATATKVRS